MSEEPGPGLVVFTRDLRIHDQPALAAALTEHRTVVPAFVFDDRIESLNPAPRRGALLEECLADLGASLRTRGGALVVRRGRWAEEVLRLAASGGASAVHVSEDVTGYARRRLDELEREAGRSRLRVVRHPGISFVPPGLLAPPGNDHYQVFTPYYRRWRLIPGRARSPAPRRIEVPTILVDQAPTPGGPGGRRGDRRTPVGEGAARRRLAEWLRRGLSDYAGRDQLARPGTSLLSASLHFGSLSPLDVVRGAARHDGSEAFLRQLCWRDFFLQIVGSRPEVIWSGLRPAPVRATGDARHFQRWCEGSTGYPVVDAAMRQLDEEGYIPNRARMIVASFLTARLRLPWQWGAEHFLRTLADGDVVVNNLNWQWVAGVGTGNGRVRALNPLRQALRFDPDGEYVRRHVPELESLAGGAVHDPAPAVRRRCGYPMPVVSLQPAAPFRRH